MDSGRGILIFGGSFNPLHIGHLRLAIEASEILADRVSSVEFVPVARPAHKDAAGLLPFAMRVEMITRTVDRFPDMSCNDLEGRRKGPSYSYETLEEFRVQYPSRELYFLIGSADYALLQTWKRGLELGSLCTLVVVPRGSFSYRNFLELSGRLFGVPCHEMPESGPGLAGIRAGNGDRLVFLDVPWLDISASAIRKSWLKKRNIDYLVPPDVIKMLERHRAEALACWQEK